MKSRMKDTLLLVGDAASDRSNLHAIFEPNFYLLEAEDAQQGVLLLEQNKHCIAAVIADLPDADGAGLRALVAAVGPAGAAEVPLVCLISPTGTGQREETAFLIGVEDVVHKPYTTAAIRQRIQVLVDLYAHRWHLEQLVENQSQTIRKTNQTMVDTLSAIIEHRNTESGNHVLRIRGFTHLLLQEVGRCFPEYGLSDVEIDRISSAAALHDIGKISIADSILNKPGPLTPEEFEIMKTHTVVGAQLTEQIDDIGDPMYLRYIYNICLYHHERWDGRGYPKGLKGNDIPICAQAVGLADAYDALTTPRVYKPAFSHEQSVNMILNGECGAFSPKLLECFKRVRDQFAELALRYLDGDSPKSQDIRVPLPTPVQKAHALNALELSQVKYQTLLHHLNDTVIELDIDHRIYHVVYNPDPDFVSLFENATFDELSRQLLTDQPLSEDDKSLAASRAELAKKLFRENQLVVSFHSHIFSHVHNATFPYRITLLRVNTGVPTQRLAIAIFHRILEQAGGQTHMTDPRQSVLATFRSLADGTLTCRADNQLTIERGAGTLYTLTGYSGEEIRQQFQNSLLQMIAEDDRAAVQAAFGTPLASMNKLRLQYRLMRKNAPAIWVQDTCRGEIDLSGAAISCHLLTDISESKQQQIELQRQATRHESLVDLSEGVILEWNLRTGEVFCSERWEQRFGYALTRNITTDFSTAAHIHPDDIPLMKQKFASLSDGKHSAFVDIRIANSDGRYLWSRVRAKAMLDENGIAERIICIIYDIDELKTDALTMKKQAQLDGLTKLLNKASTQQTITEYLNNRESGTQAALLIMDLDNFKAVNDTLGHMYGDAVLTQIGVTLRNLFRAQDVIGRIGGDEFLILLKNIPGRELVEDRCALVVDTFREQLQRLMPNLPVSVSVGAALAPGHGTNYADLFRHADEALYIAKRNGKCQFHIYDAADAFPTLIASQATRIDSDELPTMNDETMMRYVFEQLYESRDLDTTINSLLAFIGTHFNVSRVYIFENNDDNTCCSNTFEWCNAGIQPEKDNLQNLSYETDIPGWPEVYGETGVLYCTDITELDPRFREILEPQGIKSMVHCAIMDRGVFRGYVGFDECTANHMWTQGQVDMLKILAKMMAVFLVKQRTADKK